MKNGFFDKFLNQAEFLAFTAYWGHFGRMEIDKASNLGASIARKLGPLSSANRTATRNLRLAFPKISAAEEAEILDGMWDNLGRVAGEMPHLGKLGYFHEKARVKGTGYDILDSYKEKGHGAIFASGHFANWEVMAALIVQRGIECEMTYRPMNNHKIDEVIKQARADYGTKLFAPKGTEGGMRLMRILAKGGSMAMMNDQKYNTGVETVFFGHKCMTNDAAVRFAHRFKKPIQFIELRRTQGANFEFDVLQPYLMNFEAPLEEVIDEGMQKITNFIEENVRKNPSQWFWVHARWPKQAWIDAGVM